MPAIRAIDPLTWLPDYPIVVLSDVSQGLMTDADRDYIWKEFGVPVFEYLVDENEILAQECEAHEGLHLTQQLDGLVLEVTNEPCPCGRPGDRVIGVGEAAVKALSTGQL
jgi:hypothetical protein